MYVWKKKKKQNSYVHHIIFHSTVIEALSCQQIPWLCWLIKVVPVGGVGQVARYHPSAWVMVCVMDNDHDVCVPLASYTAC